MPIRWDASIVESKRSVYWMLAIVQPLLGLSILLGQRELGVDEIVLGCMCLALGLVGAVALLILQRRRRQQ